ncbi:MAG: BrnT family toxin [Geminicoccaceae bacterium]
MEVEFDGEKDRANRRKHGISLAAAAEMDFIVAQIIPDDRRDYGEARLWAVAPIGGRLHVLTFIIRGEVVRAISLRKANDRERRRYERCGRR